MAVAFIEAIFKANTIGYTSGVAKAAAETKGLSSATGSSIKNLEKAETALSKTGGASYQFSRRLYGLQAITQQFTGGAEKGFAGLSGAATVSFAAAGAAAVYFGVKSVQAYNEHEDALIHLQGAIRRSPALLGASTKAFDDQAVAIQKLTGANRDSILQADAVLARFKLTAAQIKSITPLIVDYAQVTGMDVPSAATAIGRALLGNTRALKTIGIQFKATGDTARDFATIQDLLASKVGGAAEAYGKTLPGQIAILKGSFRDLEIEVGQKLVPTLATLTKLLNDFAKAGGIKLLGEAIASSLKPIQLMLSYSDKVITFFERIGHSSGVAAVGTRTWTGATERAAAQARDYAQAQKELAESIQVQKITAQIQAMDKASIVGRTFSDALHSAGVMVSQFVAAFGGSMAQVKAGLIDTATKGPKALDDALSGLQDKLASFKTSIADAFGAGGTALQQFSGQTKVSFKQINDALVNEIQQQNQWLADYDKILRVEGPKKAGAFLQSMTNMGIGSVGVMNTVARSSKSNMDKVIGNFNKTEKGAKSLADKLTQSLTRAVNQLTDAISAIKPFLFNANNNELLRVLNDTHYKISKAGFVGPFHAGGPVVGGQPHPLMQSTERLAKVELGEYVVDKHTYAANRALIESLPKFHSGGAVGIVDETAGMVDRLSGFLNKARGPEYNITLHLKPGAWKSPVPKGVAGSYSGGDPYEADMRRLFGAQLAAAESIVRSESGFNPLAQNPTSTAYGRWQFLNSTWAGVGGHKTSDPYLQDIYGQRYVNSRYGGANAAWAFHLAHGWYGNGLDAVFRSPTMIGVGDRPERVTATPLDRMPAASSDGRVVDELKRQNQALWEIVDLLQAGHGHPLEMDGREVGKAIAAVPGRQPGVRYPTGRKVGI